ncbi:MAG: TIGR02391 family protein [Actinomycetota bacterium]|nr:TIGR02391 family protein [Actinomycetota bacterium]
MGYDLTESQQELASWMVEAVRAGRMREEFLVSWLSGVGVIMNVGGQHPEITKGALDALAAAGLIVSDANFETKTSTSGGKRSKVTQTQRERSRRCTLTGKAFAAVDSGFDAPDTSFVRHLTPLAEETNLDPELKQRCLPMLGAGSADPALWDSAARVALVVLEERIRRVAGITDQGRTGRELVNDVFAKKGAMADRFESASERDGYRDLFAGVVGVFRNRYAHRLVDPTPEDGGALIVFVNLLLKMTDDLERGAK